MKQTLLKATMLWQICMVKSHGSTCGWQDQVTTRFLGSRREVARALKFRLGSSGAGIGHLFSAFPQTVLKLSKYSQQDENWLVEREITSLMPCLLHVSTLWDSAQARLSHHLRLQCSLTQKETQRKPWRTIFCRPKRVSYGVACLWTLGFSLWAAAVYLLWNKCFDCSSTHFGPLLALTNHCGLKVCRNIAIVL